MRVRGYVASYYTRTFRYTPSYYYVVPVLTRGESNTLSYLRSIGRLGHHPDDMACPFPAVHFPLGRPLKYPHPPPQPTLYIASKANHVSHHTLYYLPQRPSRVGDQVDPKAL